MVESILPGARVAVPAPTIAPTIAPRKEYLNPDGSAVPDVVAYHHRPEDLGDMSDQTVPDGTGSSPFGEDGLTFADLLDIINPLQHIPIVSTIYRALTGDEISPAARIAGGALFGGPIGFAVAIVNAAVEAATGEDIGDTVLAALTDDAPTKTEQIAAAPQSAEAEATVAVAGSDPAAPTPERPLLAAGASYVGACLPFGGMGALPLTTASKTINDPIAAVLLARSIVPMAGPIPGLGSAPFIGSRLSDNLAVLAVQTAVQPPKQDDDNDDSYEPVERNAAAHPQFAPNSTISQTMLDTLDRYRQMKQAEFGNLPG